MVACTTVTLGRALSFSAFSGLRVPALMTTLSAYFSESFVTVAVPTLPVAPMTKTTWLGHFPLAKKKSILLLFVKKGLAWREENLFFSIFSSFIAKSSTVTVYSQQKKGRKHSEAGNLIIVHNRKQP